MMVLKLGDNISMVWDASLSIPPMIWMPVGESQDTWPHLVALSLWLVSHWPVKVEHVLSSPRPPHRISPVAVCSVRPGGGRSGKVQVLPFSRITSADFSAP